MAHEEGAEAGRAAPVEREAVVGAGKAVGEVVEAVAGVAAIGLELVQLYFTSFYCLLKL